MAEVKEARMARQLEKLIDTMDLDVNWLVVSFTTNRGATVQLRLFHILMAFIRHWAARYQNGHIQQGQRLYEVCQTSHRMVSNLPDADPLSPWV